jgi:hypothetical protein
MSNGPWRRHVSPVFFLLLVVAGLMVGLVGFIALIGAAHTIGL